MSLKKMLLSLIAIGTIGQTFLHESSIFAEVPEEAYEATYEGGSVDVIYEPGENNLIQIKPFAYESVGGGQWYHGVNGTKVYSEYLHNGKKHSATAKNGNGAGKRDIQELGVWATSYVNATLTGNKAYWDAW